MSTTRSLASFAFALALFALPARATSVLGPSYPPDGGSVSFSATGSLPGDPAGMNFNFTSFVLSPAAIDTYWGPNSSFPITASLDGTPDVLSFDSISGTVARWKGTTSWKNPDTSIVYPSVSIELLIDVTGLGISPWVLATSVAGLDPGPGSGIGAVVDTLDGTNFTANLRFRALHPITTTYTAINVFEQPASPSGLTTSSFVGGFYTVVPEPGTALLLASGLAGLAAVLRMRP